MILDDIFFLVHVFFLSFLDLFFKTKVPFYHEPWKKDLLRFGQFSKKSNCLLFILIKIKTKKLNIYIVQYAQY